MDYQQSRAYVKDADQYAGGALDLTNIKELMNRLGNPQDRLKYVHVAGTNGKGSVIAYLYTTLSDAGYRVGRYISPSVYSYREKMEVDGRAVSREAFAGYITRVAAAIEEMTEEGLAHPTPFEIETAVAFLFFAEEKCDLVILEVGMGGNLDATNIIKNTVLAVLVPISMDHQAFLGNTLAEIAQKKAGIIKPGCSVVTVGQQPETMEVIRNVCQEKGADLTETDLNSIKALKEDFAGQILEYREETYKISLAGSYQTENAALALDALEVLNHKGYPTTVEQRKKGLEETKWNGRLTIIHRNPLFIVDGAHNPAAADMLVQSIEHYFKGKRLIYIMGVFSDKDYQSVIRKTAPLADQIFTIQTPNNVRALPAQKLAEAIEKTNPHVEAAESVEAAVEKAYGLAEGKDVILAFGSLSFIGIMTEAVEEEKKKRKEQQND